MGERVLSTLKAKFRALFIAMILVFAGLGVFATVRMSALNESTRELATVWLPRAKSAQAMGTLVSTYRIREARHVLSPIEGKAGADQVVAEADASVSKGLAEYRRMMAPGEDATLVNAFEHTWKAYKASNTAMIDASRAGRADEAADLFRAGKDSYDGLVAAARAIADRDGREAAAFATQSAQLYEAVRLSTFAVVGLVLACAVGLMIYFERRVTALLVRMTHLMGGLARGDFQLSIIGVQRKDEIGDMARALEVFRDNGLQAQRVEAEAKAQAAQIEAERQQNEAARAAAAREQKMVVETLATGLETLSAGDLTIRLNERFPGDYEKLREDFNVAIERLEGSVRQAVESAGAIASGTGEISSAADNLARRTEQQAANIEETAAALEQITATVRKTSSGVADASRAVMEATADTDRGSEIVTRAIEGMSEIEKSAQQISQIIGVIDEIAFQTNLLALNAGVEAARAGDAGKGFAVVASEVRALAQRSGEAAKEIKALISESSAQVETGVKLVGETGEALQRIAVQITGINRLMNQMATSASEQATGIEQVNAAVASMDQATQQNAAMVEESTAATRALADEGRGLAAVMGRFRLAGFDTRAGQLAA